MIVNSVVINQTMNTQQMGQTQSNENFYLKRKLDGKLNNDTIISNNDLDDHHLYVNNQMKKRHIEYSFQINSNNFDTSSNNDENFHHHDQHQEIIHENSLINHCSDLQFNLSNNSFVNDTIEYLNYDNQLIEPIPTVVVQSATFSNNNGSGESPVNEQFDTTNWQNSNNLLELDQKYNAINYQIDKNQQHQTDLNQHQQLQTEITLIEQQQQEQTRQDLQMQQHEKEIQNGSSIETDFEDKNLSWLFNFKLDELPHLSPDVQNCSHKITVNNNGETNCNSQIVSHSHQPVQQCQKNQQNQYYQQHQNKVQTKTGKKVDELIKEVTAEMAEENEILAAATAAATAVENSIENARMPKKPPFTYTELIEYALEDRGELTVSGIYQWISDRFPFYKSNDDRWKNSVRHNLSINPHFRKGVKAPQGAGHLWTISSRDSEENALAWEHKKQRLELFFKMEELQIAKHLNNQAKTDSNCGGSAVIVYDEAATAAATIAQQLGTTAINESLTSLTNDLRLCQSPLTTNDCNTCLPIDNLIEEDILKKAAGEILNGVRRMVEVQPINTTTINSFHENLLDNEDYLNPITKDDAIIESGLRNEFYVTEIDPIELGINMSNVEEEVLFNEEFNLNYFGSDIVA